MPSTSISSASNVEVVEVVEVVDMTDVASVVATVDELEEGDEVVVELLLLAVVEGVVVIEDVVDADAGAVLVDTVVLVKIDTDDVDVEPGKVASNADSTKQRTINFI